MKRKPVALVISAALVCAANVVPAWTQPALAGSPESNALTIADVVDREYASSFDIAPDASRVVWVKSTVDRKKNGRRSNIYITRVDDEKTRALTHGSHRDGSPKFSPDGTRVAFLGSRGKDAKTQVWILNLDGGEPVAGTTSKVGVRSYAWLDNHSLVYTAREDSTLREKNLARAKDDVLVVSDAKHYTPVRLFRRDLDSKKTKRLTRNKGAITSMSLSPDGHLIAMSINVDIDYGYNNDNPPQQYLYNVKTGTLKEFCTAPNVDPYNFKWAADSRGFYCERDVASDSTHTFISIPTLEYYDVSRGTLSPVATGATREIGYNFYPIQGGALVALAAGVRDHIVALNGARNSPRVRHIHTKYTTYLRAARPEKRVVVYSQSTASTLPDVYFARVDRDRLRDARMIVSLNKSLRKKTLAQRKIIHWAGAQGDSVEGILYYPIGWDKSRTYPCIAWIHGGPSARDIDYFTDRVSSYPNVMAARHTFILKVNYHGSSGYGLKWVESIKDHYYELEVPDILKGLDNVVARGLVDPDRIGIMGWSNGSILSIASCVEDKRFKVLCAGAGDVNWTSDYGNCAFGAGFDEAYFGGTPWDNLSDYVRKSPLFRMKHVKTPTLIMFGEKDTSVPTEQGWQHFRMMQRIGIAPVRFLIFPGAGHGLRKRSHQLRKMSEELAWIDRYLFGDSTHVDEAVDKNSLLAIQLNKAKCARVGSLYGHEVDATLVPETVSFQSLQLGRFEVTNAQFAAFDPNFSYPANRDNLPVTRISLPLAQAYCMWLSKKTHAHYRLPTKAEMDSFLDEAGAGGQNTLNRWIGRVPTPDELPALEAKIQTLEESRSLLEPVGSFAPTHGVYDLNGNAAEWVVGDDGKGTIEGACAAVLVDTRRERHLPPLAYVSFRVIREQGK